ncbi:MAG: TonB-dependent receptor [Paludibacteraceae bacterium]|nr:TonB-dependent receptor [Paludibacteraceae bacterium]
MNQKILSSILLFANTTSVVLATDYNNKAVSEENKKRDQENTVFDTQLDEVVVTATHTPKALKDVPVVTRLIPLADLKKADATNVQDLLTQELPGLEFGFAMSQETSLNMSGFGGNAVLFLVDGERLAGETMDNTDYNRLNMDDVGRIEIVKGASSALYGSNAVGGVINILTRESTERWTANVNSRYCSMGDEWRNGVRFSFNLGKWNSQTSFQQTKIDPIKLSSGPTSEEKAIAALLGKTVEEDKSNVKKLYGQESFNIKERLKFSPSESLKFIARGSYFYRESQRETYNYHFNGYSGGLKTLYDWKNGGNIEVSYAYDQYDKANYTPEGIRTHDHDYRNAQHTVHALYNNAFGKNVLTVGTDLLHDYLNTYQFLDNASHEQNNIDAYAQFDYNPTKRFNVVGSVRYDHFSASDKQAVTARLATVYKFDKFTLRANYANGFRAPSLKEMYMHFDMGNMGYMIIGNPDVEPEKSNNFNLAVEHNNKVTDAGILNGQYNLTLMGYCNIFDKRITNVGRYWVVDDSYREGGYQVLYDDERIREEGDGYVFIADDGTEYKALTSSLYWNEDGVQVWGLDFSSQYRLDMGLGFRYNYSFLHESGNVIDSQFTQPRSHTMTWRTDYDHTFTKNYAISVVLSGRHLGKPQSGRKDVDQGYTLWKLMLQQHIHKGVHLNFAVDNLFNYKPKAYYYCSPMTTGSNFSVGLSLDIDNLVNRKI